MNNLEFLKNKYVNYSSKLFLFIISSIMIYSYLAEFVYIISNFLNGITVRLFYFRLLFLVLIILLFIALLYLVFIKKRFDNAYFFLLLLLLFLYETTIFILIRYVYSIFDKLDIYNFTRFLSLATMLFLDWIVILLNEK